MFYREFLKITNLFDEHFVDTFDFWLTTLPDREARTISVSTVASDVSNHRTDAIQIGRASCRERV